MMFAKSLVKFKQLNIDLENVEQNHMIINFRLLIQLQDIDGNLTEYVSIVTVKVIFCQNISNLLQECNKSFYFK